MSSLSIWGHGAGGAYTHTLTALLSPALKPAHGWLFSQDETASWLLLPLRPTRAPSMPTPLGSTPSRAQALAAQTISILNL